MSNIELLIALVAKLRDKRKGCPWIIEQDFKSLVSKTLEESYELADSIDQGNFNEVRDELADLLLHIVLYAEIAHENGLFNFDEIATAALNKQLRRKLNFPDPTKITAKEALAQWEINKQEERNSKQQNRSVLDNVSPSLPAIHRCLKLQHQAATTGFDWPTKDSIFDKLNEEIHELKQELKKNLQTSPKQKNINITDELGDLFFTCVALAKHLGIDPELALRHANHKFEKRFRALEQKVKNQGKKLENLTVAKIREMWKEIKRECQIS